MKAIPKHLQRYIVEQNSELYTYEDQAVWRFIMRQLFSYLKEHAHETYVEGLKKTGISIEAIPSIENMDRQLSKFGWRAVPVSGFIPPAAFMSFQANRILPIAAEIRSLEHILYTPAPDIVHEAAGHAPILIDPQFTDYLSAYAEVAQKAIISSEDLALYEAIRDLSDIKEDPSSTKEDIQMAEEHLETTSQNMTYVSEAQYLGRMNWWTAEYGLIGSLEQPKIFGAGLLSSVGEALSCLKKPQHLPFSIDCLNYSYDITEQQPQLFVAKDFADLTTVLNEMSGTMAYKKGGEDSLKKAHRAQSVCSICVESGKVYSGVVQEFHCEEGLLKSLSMKAPILCDDSNLLHEDTTFHFGKGQKIISVYGGPSSFEKYPSFEDFKARRVTSNKITNEKLERLLKDIRSLREKKEQSLQLEELKIRYYQENPQHWLAGLELLELDPECTTLHAHMNNLLKLDLNEEQKSCIRLGLELISQV